MSDSKRFIDKRDILIPQKHHSMTAFVWIIIAAMSIQWMTLDMYLPALPVLKEEFHTTEAMLNLSLNSDLILCAIGTLIGGTVSDKYGRNPIMIFGLALSAAAMFLAALSQGVVFLTIMRGLCGLGGGFALTVASAVIRDSFQGRTFQFVTTVTQAAAIIGPVLAPASGAFLIQYLSWRWIFIVLAIATVLTLIPFFFATETWPKKRRHVDSIWQATVQTFHLAKNHEYVIFLTLTMMITVPIWAYLGTCSYIYYDDFGVSNLMYSVLYTIGALTAFFAPFIYIRISMVTTGRHTIEFIMLFLMVGAALLILVGGRGPVLFMIACIPIIMTEAMIRSMSMVVILEEYPEEAGSASALTGFALMMIGVIGTAIATLHWSSFLFGNIVITVISILLAVLFWAIILKKKIYSKQLQI